jgi:methyltransferase-like protein
MNKIETRPEQFIYDALVAAFRSLVTKIAEHLNNVLRLEALRHQFRQSLQRLNLASYFQSVDSEFLQRDPYLKSLNRWASRKHRDRSGAYVLSLPSQAVLESPAVNFG